MTWRRSTPGVELIVADDEGRPLPTGATGEIWLRTRATISGYHRNPEGTAAEFTNGFWKSGDLGYVDDGGYLFIVDRKKDMIITGGFNVYAVEVEAALSEHPAVMMSAVVGVPHADWGEAVHAEVILRQDITTSTDELIDHVKARLGGYKAPKTIKFVDELPLSPVGKVLRRQVKERYWAAETAVSKTSGFRRSMVLREEKEAVMRFLIVGAGALGGYYGGMLLKGGADVTFLVRPRRAAQLAERGLTIKEADNTFTTSVRTVQAGALGEPCDVVFLACKAYDLDGAITDFAPALVADGAVLPVLNGINHLAVLTDRLGANRVLGGVAWFSAVLTADGEIAIPGAGMTGQTSFGELTGERSPRCERIDAALRAGGIASTLLDDVIADMWAKFCGLASAAAISTLTRGKTGDIAAAPAGAGFVDATLDECARVTTAEGYPPPAAVLDMYRRAYSRIGTAIAPSILLDVENGRPTEGEHIIGDLVRRADRLGVQVPILRAALCNLQIYEARRSARV